MTLIDIALKGADANTLASGGIYEGNPPSEEAENMIEPGKRKAKAWSKDLEPGAYTFQIDAEAPAGTALSVAVTNHATGNGPAAAPVPMNGQPGTVVEYIQNVPFTVAADGTVS